MATGEAYEDIHHVQSLSKATIEDLGRFIRTFPIIDNHAHNLLKEEHAHGAGSDYPFECIVSEAQGHALHAHGPNSLAHIQGIRQLAELFKCPATLRDVKDARNKFLRKDYNELIHKCLEGTHCLLIDDGLPQEHVYAGKWHRKFVPRVSRIARIEAIAAELLEHLVGSSTTYGSVVENTWTVEQSGELLFRFHTMFGDQIRKLVKDPNVRGFKSVICYRSGLDVQLDSRGLFAQYQSLTGSTLLSAFHDFIYRAVRDRKYRVQQKEVNDYLVLAVCDVLHDTFEASGENLPIQFHTGLGDTDIDLIKANPAYMQSLIEAYPSVDFVLLHSSYPYTREAGYLATNFANAWLDIGEVFPMLSRDGEETVIRHALELTPASKILWSTDGHFYPESFYLANKQFRAALERVLTEYVQVGDLTTAQAITAASDIMFWNSNTLYKLEEELRYPQLVAACGRSSSSESRTAKPGSGHRSSKDIAAVRAKTSTVHGSGTTNRRSTGSVVANTPAATVSARSLLIADDFLQANPSVKYIWAQFVDYTGMTRVRMIPIHQFKKHISSGVYPSITSALPRLLQNDYPAEGCSATGEFRLLFDTSSLSLNKVIDSPSATVQSYWMKDSGPYPNEHFYACPRWALQRHLNLLKQDYDINIKMGFEIEIIFVKPVLNEKRSDYREFEPLHMVHSWSNMTIQQLDVLPVVEEIVEILAELDIKIGQFHSEAAPGQWEFPLPTFEPLKAIDVLYKAREVIRFVARKHGLKATLYPRPYPFTCGSASHAHFSINGSEEVVSKHEDSFLAGVLECLPSLLAFTLPIDESYQRVASGVWAGGEYVAWGTQNREAAIRKCGPAHWELKTIDGMGNMYLSMAALVAAGLHGIEQQSELTLKDCPYDASSLSDADRTGYGITTRLPKSIRESLDKLDKNDILKAKLGTGLVDDYVAVKTAEAEALDAKSKEDRRIWLMSRY